MNRFFLSLIFLLLVSFAFSQRVYFVYLQNESLQPFYVKLNGKTINSGKDGYLVVPKLVDSTYELSIGSPESKLAEQKFSIKVNAQDHGYLLKRVEDKSWGLFDLQNLSVVRSSTTAAVAKETRQVSAFTDVLSKAANDPTLKEKPIEIVKEETPVVTAVVKEEKPVTPQPALAQQEIKKDTVVAAAPVVVKAPEVKQEIPAVVKEESPIKEEIIPAAIESTYQKSTITRRSESSTTEGLGLTFIDEYSNGVKDTIRIIIPNTGVSATPLQSQPVTVAPVEQKKEDKQFLNIESDPTIVSSNALRKNDCTSVATESDFLKLRKKMAAEIKADAMLAEARKGFKAKCYTVAQVKNLGTLFLEEDGRYRFFDEAFMHVSDKENFSTLSSELKQEYYINRFNAMLK